MALDRALGGGRAVMTDVAPAAFGHDTVLMSAGRRGLDLEIAPADLVTTTEAIVDRVGRS